MAFSLRGRLSSLMVARILRPKRSNNMGSAPSSETEPLRIWLDHKDHEGKIVVTPSDGDRFVVKIGKAIELLRQRDRTQFDDQFKLLMRQLGAWLKEHKNWSRALITGGEGVLRFIVVRKDVTADDEMTDALSDLDFEIANDPDLNLIKLNATALPRVSDEALQSFLDPSFSLEYAGGEGT